MSQSSSLVRPASDDALVATSSKVNLSRNTSVISTVSSSSSLDVPPLQTRSHMSDTFLHTPEPKRRPPAWLTKRFNKDADDNGGTQTPRAAASPAPPANGTPQMTSPDDFEFGEEIGGGSWSIVVDAIHISTGRHYAIKILNKAQLVKEKMTQSAVAEKKALATLKVGDHPGIIILHSAFQDSTSLYFVLSLAPNGDLRELVKSVGSFSVDCARYYAATIVDTVQWMHTKGVLHRDLKPENILLDANMRIKLADFGSAYVSEQLDLSPRASTFVGTAAYVSPELLSGPQKMTSLSSDLWALGCIIYFLLVGQSPFLALTDYLSFKKIEKLDYTFMEGFDPDARDLIQRLIVTDPTSRLGTPPKSSPQELRDHPFFIGHGLQDQDSTGKYINWQSLWSDPPARIESGLVHPPLPLPSNDKLANGLAWVDFINEFSVISLDQERPEASPVTPRGEVADEELYPEDPRTPIAPTFGDKLNTVVPTANVVDASSIPTINGNGNNFTNEKLDDKETLKTIVASDTKPLTSLKPEELKIVNDHSWSLILLPQETILRITKVEVRTGRRPFQRTDQRILAFTTSPRIICVKARYSLTGNGTLVLKQEFLFPKSPVNRTGKRLIKVTSDLGGNLVFETPEKLYTYRILNKPEAQSWFQHIQELLR